jgi:hypothetical protein
LGEWVCAVENAEESVPDSELQYQQDGGQKEIGFVLDYPKGVE